MLENDNALKFECINKRIDNMAKCFKNMQEEISLLKNENAELKKLFNIETLKETNDNSIEQWFDIDGWEGFYQISNLGNVKSLKREFINRGGGLSKVKEKILKPQYDSGKQKFYVTLTYLGRAEKFYIENLIPTKHINENVKFKYPNITYRILQYDLNRRLVHQWNSFKELREQTTYSIERISQCCRDKSKKYNNYYWEKVSLPL